MRSLLWLASYPKSGNTWLRAFLSNYIWNQPEPVAVNDLSKLGTSDAAADLYAKICRGPFDYTDPRLTTSLRGSFLNAVDGNGADVNFIKTHNQNSVAFDVELVPPALTRSAIYILRDPRDMVISYASHLGLTVDKAIEGMNNVNNATAGTSENVQQYLGRWSDHVTSWTRTKKFPVLTLRYEDML
ncbi:MAG: sulfotransferase domain-containing protein, partial [Pseudomonadota bacterium]